MGNNSNNTLFSHDLEKSKILIYKPCGYKCSTAVAEAESTEYGACDFKLDKLIIKFRISKITPTKIGQFVTLWKRSGRSPIQPFDVSDKIDLFIISVRDENSFGQFIFSKQALLKQNILSNKNIGGKRAIRVYPPWVITTSTQAAKTQKWQSEFFLNMSDNHIIDLAKAKKLIYSKAFNN
jgi:hypothetical protein